MKSYNLQLEQTRLTQKPKCLYIIFTSETWTFAVFLCQTLYELCAPQFKSDIYTDSLSNENKALILRHIISHYYFNEK